MRARTPSLRFFCHMKFHCRKRRLRRSAAVVKIMTVERDAAEGGRDGQVCAALRRARGAGRTDKPRTKEGRRDDGGVSEKMW